MVIVLVKWKSNVSLSHVSTWVTKQGSFHTSVNPECQWKPGGIKTACNILVLWSCSFWVRSSGHVKKQSCTDISWVANVVLTHSWPKYTVLLIKGGKRSQWTRWSHLKFNAVSEWRFTLKIMSLWLIYILLSLLFLLISLRGLNQTFFQCNLFCSVQFPGSTCPSAWRASWLRTPVLTSKSLPSWAWHSSGTGLTLS